MFRDILSDYKNLNASKKIYGIYFSTELKRDRSILYRPISFKKKDLKF